MEAYRRLQRAQEGTTEVAFLASPIGPGLPWPTGINWRVGFPLPFASLTVPSGLVMARLAADPDMYATLGEADIALLDVLSLPRATLDPNGLYAVNRRNEAVLRYIRAGTSCYYLVTDVTWDCPNQWEPLRVLAASSTEFVKARVLWLGREQHRYLPMRQRGRFLDEAISS